MIWLRLQLALAWLEDQDAPEAREIAEALRTGVVRVRPPTCVERLGHRDTLLRRLRMEYFAPLSTHAAAVMIAEGFAKYRLRAWPHRRARLLVEPPGTAARVFFELCLGDAAALSIRQVERILNATSPPVAMSQIDAAASPHARPGSLAARPAAQPRRQAARPVAGNSRAVR